MNTNHPPLTAEWWDEQDRQEAESYARQPQHPAYPRPLELEMISEDYALLRSQGKEITYLVGGGLTAKTEWAAVGLGALAANPHANGFAFGPTALAAAAAVAGVSPHDIRVTEDGDQ